jgi:hypothetical protein
MYVRKQSVIVCFFGFSVAVTVFQSYCDVQLITGGGRPQVHRATQVEPPQVSWKASSHENPKCPGRDLNLTSEGLRNCKSMDIAAQPRRPQSSQ